MRLIARKFQVKVTDVETAAWRFDWWLNVR